MAAYEVPRGAVIIGGASHPCAVEVRRWKETGLAFTPGHGGRPRRDDIDLIVAHYTAGKGDAPQVYRTLTARGLGVDFVVDQAGIVWQFSDPVVLTTLHAGHVNGRSVGIEVCSIGAPQVGFPADTYTANVHGRKVPYVAWPGKQLKAVVSLIETLCESLEIPRVFPGEMREIGLDGFTGVCGHLHVTARKLDPGTQIFDELEKVGFKRTKCL